VGAAAVPAAARRVDGRDADVADPCCGGAAAGHHCAIPSYRHHRELLIDAPPTACFAALTDYERLPEWQRAVRAVRVLERDESGRGLVVEYEVDAKVKTVRYRLRQVYDEPHRLGSEYLGGDFRDFSGEWRFHDVPADRTRAELELSIDPGRLVPRPLRGLISEAVMSRALSDLKAYVEARCAAPHG
jgi:ribosome-associated toxin RatA of RatAB toxin-antitoxin module